MSQQLAIDELGSQQPEIVEAQPPSAKQILGGLPEAGAASARWSPRV
jgi:hypothetical protein